MRLNGRLEQDDLSPIPWAPARQVANDVLYSLTLLNDTYRQTFHVNLSITSAYRTLAEQQKLYDRLGARRAAVPGYSDHGWGTAIDFGGGIETHNSPQWQWMDTNSRVYGWVPYSDDRPQDEPWHWQCAHPLTPPDTNEELIVLDQLNVLYLYRLGRLCDPSGLASHGRAVLLGRATWAEIDHVLAGSPEGRAFSTLTTAEQDRKRSRVKL